MADRINISVGLTADIQDFIKNIQTQFGNLKGLGLDKAAKGDIDNIMKMLNDLSKSMASLGGSKVNTSTFAKAQKEIIDKVQALEIRTNALEENMASLVSTMSKADSGKFANALKDINDNMQKLQTTTVNTVDAIQQISQVNTSGLQQEVTSLEKLAKTIESITEGDVKSVKLDSNIDSIVADLTKLSDKYDELQYELSKTDVGAEKYSQLRAQLVETAKSFQELYTSMQLSVKGNIADTAGDVFINGEKLSNIADWMIDDLTDLKEEVSSRIVAINEEILKVGNIPVQQVSSRIQSATKNNALTVPIDISTKSSTLLNRALKIIETVNNGLADKPIEAQLVLTTAWGTRKNKALLNQFQEQIDNLSKETDVTELKKLADSITTSFGDEIDLKFKSNFTEEVQAITKGISALKKEIGRNLVINPRFKLNDEDLEKYKEQLKEITDSIRITIADTQKSEKAEILDSQELKIDKESLAQIEEYLFDIGKFGLNTEQALKPMYNMLYEINNLLSNNPLAEITAEVKELADILRQAFGIMSVDELDQMFINIKSNVEGITGSLKKADNLSAIKDILRQFNEYQSAGGKNSLSDLGGSRNVKGWLSRHANDNIEESVQSLREEATTLHQVEAASKVAASAKGIFADQNEKVDASARTSADSIEQETDAMRAFPENPDLLRWMQDIQNGFNSHPIELGIELDKASLQNQLKEVAPQIAEAWNKQYGTTLTGKDVVKAWNDAQKQSELNHLKEREKEVSDEILAIDIKEAELAERKAYGEQQVAEILKRNEDYKRAWTDEGGLIDQLDAEAYRKAWQEAEEYKNALKELNDAKAEGIAQSKAYNKEIEKQYADYTNLFQQAEVNLKKSYSKNMTSLTNSFVNVDSSKYVSNIREQIEKLQSEITELNSHPIDLSDNNEIAYFDNLVNQAIELKLAMRNADNQLADLTSIGGEKNKIADFLRDNTRMAKEAREALERMYDTLDSGAEITKPLLKQIDSGFREISASVKRADQSGDSLFTKINKQLTSMNANLVATYLSWRDIIRYIRTTAEAVTKLDSALTELRKVSDASTERLAQSFEKSAQTAQELGSTISHVINVTADWARLGYDVDAAEELARVTTLFTTVGDNMSADDASSFLISSLQGFQLSAEQAEDIVDKYNEVANNFAIDTRGIGAALERSAASFYAANTDISKSIALVTTANSVVQNPEAVGTTFKTLSARIRGAKTELEELGEEEDEFTKTTSKLRDLVKGLTGFDIMKDEDTFKDIYDIIVGIGKEWNNLTDIERASLGEALAGKRNSNALYAVLNNIETLERAYETAEESAGSAAKEQENYSKSVQYSIDRVKASLEELAYDFLNSGSLKGAIEIFNSFIRVVDSAVEHLGLLQTSLLAIGGGIALGNIDAIVSKFKELSALGTMTSILKGGFDAGKVESLANALNGLSDARKIATVSSLKLTEADATAILVESGVEKQTISTSVANGALATSEGAATGATWSLSAAFEGLAASLGLSTAALGGIAIAIAAIGAIGYGVYKYNKRFEEMADAAEKAKDSVNELKQSFSDVEKKTKSLAKRYDELSKGVDTFTNKNKSLSTEEYDEYLDVVNELVEINPSLYKTLDENGNAIINFSDKTKDASGNLEEFLKQEEDVANYKISKELPDLFGGVVAKKKNLDDATESLKKGVELSETYSEALDNIVNATSEWETGFQQTVDNSTEAGRMFFNVMNKGVEDFYKTLESDRKGEIGQYFSPEQLWSTPDENYIQEFYLNTFALTDEERAALKNSIKDAYNDIKGEYIDEAGDMSNALKTAQQEFETEWIDFRGNLQAAIKSKASYQGLDDTSKLLANELVGNLSSDVASEMDDQHPERWISDNIITPLREAAEKDANGEFSSLVSELLSLDENDLRRIDLANQIQDWINKNDINVEVDLTPIIKDARAFKGKIRNAVSKSGIVGKGFDSQQQGDALQKAIKGLSTEEINTTLQFTERDWKKVQNKIHEASGTTDLVKAGTDAVRDAVKEVAAEWNNANNAAANNPAFSNETFSTQVNELDALQSAYEKFRSNVADEDALKINLDLSDVESLREKFGAIEGFDFDQFEITVTSDTSGLDDIQSAFDEALTAYANAKVELEGISETTKDMVRTQLEMEGATSESAEAFVQHALDMANAEQLVADNGVNLANATDAEIQALYTEAETLGIDANALTEYLILKGQANGGVWNLNLEALANEYEELGLNCDKLREYIALKNAAGSSGNYVGTFTSEKDFQNYQASKEAAEKQIAENSQKPLKFDIPKAKSAAGGAGKEAGDAFVDAFTKELEKLKNAYERGEISLKDYLSQWKALIQKFFADNPKYAEEYANQMKSYLDAVKGFYSGAIGGVTTILQGRISSLQKQKDKAIKQLEKEKEAALAGYQAQINAIDKLIKQKNKQIKQLEKEKKAIDKKIKPLQDEINAIQKANEERQRQIDLQKDLYELERAQNQRTQFVLKDNQMVYQTDPEAARQARDQVKQDEEDQKIAKLQEQIDLYEHQKELIDERIEAINEEIEMLEEEKEAIEEQMKAVEEYYDKLIKETEEMFDEMIEGLEEILEKWQQLAELESIKNAWKDVGGVMEMLGYTVEDVLNDTPGAFEAFKNAYIDAIMQVDNGNKDSIEGIREWGRQTGQEVDTAIANFQKLGSETTGALDPLKQPLDDTTTSTKNLGDAASTSSGNVSGLASSTGELAEKAGEADEKLSNLTESTADLPEQLSAIDKVTFENIITQLETLRAKLAEIKNALGSATTGSNGEQSLGGLGSIAGALSDLNNTSLDNLINQFTLLENAVSSVCSLLGSGGGEATASGLSGAHPFSPNAMGEASGSATSLLSALQQLQSFTFSDGITKQFKDLADAIGLVAAAIGVGGEGEDSEGSLIGALETLGETASAVLGGGSGGGEGEGGKVTGHSEGGGEGEGEGGEGIIGQFKELETTIGDVATAIGTSESEADSGDLIGSIVSLGEKSTEVMTGGDSGAGLISEWSDFNAQLSEAEDHITAMAEGLEKIDGNEYETSLTVNLTINGEGNYTGTATKGKKKGTWSFNVLGALGFPEESGSWDSVFKHNAKGTAKLKGKSNLFGDWAYDGGKTLIAEIGPELVVFPDGHFETFDKPQMVNLPRGSVIFNHLKKVA